MGGGGAQDVLRLFQCGDWPAHPPQPAEMGNETRAEGLVGRVLHSEFPAGLFDQRRKGRVMDMADAREEVVLDLEIQPADVPREQSIAAGEIDGRFDLVYGPARRHSARVRPRQRKSSLLYAMRQLKDDTKRRALYQRCRDVEQQYGPQRVQEQRRPPAPAKRTASCRRAARPDSNPWAVRTGVRQPGR